MVDRNDFQDRVNAYRAERGRQAQTPEPATGGFAFSQGPIFSAPRRRAVPSLGLMVRLSRIGVGLVPVLFGLFLLKSIYPNAFGFEMLDGLVNGTRNRAETYLPGEVGGWVCIAPSDADRDRDKALAELAGRFPGGIEALHRDPAIGMI